MTILRFVKVKHTLNLPKNSQKSPKGVKMTKIHQKFMKKAWKKCNFLLPANEIFCRQKFLPQKIFFSGKIFCRPHPYVILYYYSTRGHKLAVGFFYDHFLNKNVYACGYKIFPLVLEVTKICHSFASLTLVIFLWPLKLAEIFNTPLA